MKNEGGYTFESPPQPEMPEQSAEQIEDNAVETQRPASQEAGVGRRPPQLGSTAVSDLPAVTQIPSIPPAAPPVSEQTKTPISSTTGDLEAKDADLIEKEWVERVNSVVADTKDDPHRQKIEISKVKADYIQKRFNKTIRTDEAT
jgi:hypothetical protein